MLTHRDDTGRGHDRRGPDREPDGNRDDRERAAGVRCALSIQCAPSADRVRRDERAGGRAREC
jgi:hypothetical protein